MFKNPDEVDVIQKYKDSRDVTKLKPGRVLSYDYFIVDGEKLIGLIHIRNSLIPSLLNYGGHIGYTINPKYWRRGYGTDTLRLGLIKAKELINDNKILITCDDDNIGSYMIIENNGGILENKVKNKIGDEEFLTRRYWINI